MRTLLSVVVALLLLLGTACPGTVAPVDTSQAILVQVGGAVAAVDKVVAASIATAGEEARDMAQEQVDQLTMVRETCLFEAGGSTEAAGDCPEAVSGMDIYRDTMTSWTRLVAVLGSTTAILRTWEAANDSWRESGSIPDRWGAVVCEPVRTVFEQLSSLLPQVGVEVPDGVRQAAAQVPVLCSLGVAVAGAMAGPGNGGEQ